MRRYGLLTDQEGWEQGLSLADSTKRKPKETNALMRLGSNNLYEALGLAIACISESALELGCGSGNYTDEILKGSNTLKRIDGIDFSQKLLSDFETKVRKHNLVTTGHNLDITSSYVDELRGAYDWVYSGGLTEHFYGSMFDRVLECHDFYLKKGGYISISTPNFQGINYAWHYLFDRPSLKQHNLMAMSPEPYENYFGTRGYKVIFSGYINEPMFWGVSTFQQDRASQRERALEFASDLLCKRINGFLKSLYKSDPEKCTGEAWSSMMLFICKKL